MNRARPMAARLKKSKPKVDYEPRSAMAAQLKKKLKR